MATEKPTTVVNGKVSNPRDIVWPVDPWGFTSMLKKEGVRAVGRIKGHDEKMDIFLHTLRALGEHAKTKIADQKADAEKTAAAIQNRIDAMYARSLADQKAEVKRLKALLASAEAAVKAKEAMPKTEAE
jgi:hypothetical protein